MSPADALLVGASGLLAGAVNAVAGGGTLASFPALLAVGLSPVTANITSSVGILAGYAGGTVAYRRELADQGSRVRALLPFAVLGSVAGAVLLLLTPDTTFRAVVPYLVLLSCVLLATQPRLAKVVATRRGEAVGVPWSARVAIGLGAVYGSYFGAGLGVLMLAVLGLLIADDLQRTNALKGALSLLINVVGVVVFVLSAQVAWGYVGILAITSYVGATLGVSAARQLSPQVMRAVVITLGTVVGVVLLVR